MSARSAECTCESNFTCGYCCQNAKPYHFTPSKSKETQTMRHVLPTTNNISTGSLSFACSADDCYIISRIVDRALRLAQSWSAPGLNRRALTMDLTACHASGMPLNLQALLDTPEEGSFAHDVFGIHRHLDRATGQLTQCFVLRFARAGGL